jgi:hypothetical protein
MSNVAITVSAQMLIRFESVRTDYFLQVPDFISNAGADSFPGFVIVAFGNRAVNIPR